MPDTLVHQLTVTSLPRLISARTFFMPSPLPTCQMVASTGWFVIGQSLAWSSYQIVLKRRKTVEWTLLTRNSEQSSIHSLNLSLKLTQRRTHLLLWRKEGGPHCYLGSSYAQSLVQDNKSSHVEVLICSHALGGETKERKRVLKKSENFQ